MKAFFTRILSTALCFILAFAVIQPAFAEGTDDFVDYDAPYIAFLQQTNPDGVTNEEEIEAAKQRAFDAFDGIILGPTNDGWSHISPIFTGGYYVETARLVPVSVPSRQYKNRTYHHSPGSLRPVQCFRYAHSANLD